jgi:hypothetical protein
MHLSHKVKNLSDISSSTSTSQRRRTQLSETFALKTDQALGLVQSQLSRTMNAETGTMHTQTHPGNDCFIFKRNNIPRAILEFDHPLSFPRWGKWLPDAFKSEGVSFRRYHSQRWGIDIFVCMYVCIYVCKYACMYVCMHVCMYVCKYVCMCGQFELLTKMGLLYTDFMTSAH